MNVLIFYAEAQLIFAFSAKITKNFFPFTDCINNNGEEDDGCSRSEH